MAIVHILDSDDGFSKRLLTEALLREDMVILIPEGSSTDNYHWWSYPTKYDLMAVETFVIDSLGHINDINIRAYMTQYMDCLTPAIDAELCNPSLDHPVKPIPYKSKLSINNTKSNRYAMRSVNRNR